MREFFLVGGGGFAGSVLRYYASGFIFQVTGSARFPISTLVVNVVGCFLIGVLSAAAEHFQLLNQQTRLLLITGFLGGFTTFSAFGFETYFLVRDNHPSWAVANVLLQITLGLAAVWLGHRLIEVFSTG